MNSRHVKIGVAVVTAGVAVILSVLEITVRDAVKVLDKNKQ